MTPSELQNLPPYTGYTRHTKEIALVCQVFHSIVNDQVSHIAYFISLINFVTYQPRFFHQLLITQLSSVTFLTSHITHFISLFVQVFLTSSFHSIVNVQLCDISVQVECAPLCQIGWYRNGTYLKNHTGVYSIQTRVKQKQING